ncbi:Zinc finger C2H2-type protein [Lasiodiplodia theobromae]|uniref:C2H2 domain containing protein n=1 Tax=Lasiodiplodia theobromae TaxID=45133 RepID=UPI0015C2EFD2|nr:C2H2 domain containing protein [Lasiodiplodia theobromae]KAF4534277.1 C2H2 domain containing protein [Lasiodiplodia theobromae]KAF9640158.1 Zinc finger C2H2-type protein [Lasiodiplodia theobromae]
MESPGSPLSELSSDEFQEEVKTEDRSLSVDTYNDADHDSTRPSKRQRTGAGPSSGLANFRGATPEAPQPDADADIYISEDTDGSVPASPHHGYSGGGGGGLQEEESFGQEQVTVCKWEGCEAGDLGNMDKLVDHLHDDHIGTRQKKYSCEWTDCARKGIPHASGYALRAHMRSHTREKPFYCTLPECDRAFTRSDALAKHMRTVHETEALRPSDPVPKHHSSNPSNKNQRLRLVFKNNGTDKPGSPMPASPHSQGAGQQQPPPPVENEYEHNNVIYRPLDPTIPHSPLTRKFPHDIQFTKEEMSLSAPDLLRLLTRQIQWATAEGEELKAEVDALEKARKDEWMAKELTLENVMEAEFGRMERVDPLLNEDSASATVFREMLREDIKVGKTLDVQPKPNWRDIVPVQKTREKEGLEAAGELTGMAGAHRFDAAGDPVVERRPENLGIGVGGGP